MEQYKITEEYMPFAGYRTYLRIAEPLEKEADRTPLLLLHGGPGSTHNYFELLDCMAKTGRKVISYDQLGCGNSFVEGRKDLWKLETWVSELKAVRTYLGLQKVHLLGQSWGGMLAIAYLIDEQPEGVESVTLSSTLSSSKLWSHEQHRRIRFLSEEDQRAIEESERTGNFDTPQCKRATQIFMERYCEGKPGKDTPECITRKKRTGAESYLTAWGPNEYTATGTLKDFDYTDRLGEIRVPALIIDGTNDLCSPLIAKTMYDRIPGARWELFDGARHMCFAEQTEKYVELLAEFIASADS